MEAFYNPTAALSPAQSQSVQAGTLVIYTVSVTNRDSSSCAKSTFGLQASAPAEGSYTIGVSGTNSGATSYTGSSSATYVIAAVAVPGITVTTNQISYAPGQTVSSTAVVTSGGNPVANATVNFAVTKSNGTVVTGSATTGATGAAVYKLKLGRKDPAGVYQVRREGQQGGGRPSLPRRASWCSSDVHLGPGGSSRP